MIRLPVALIVTGLGMVAAAGLSTPPTLTARQALREPTLLSGPEVATVAPTTTVPAPVAAAGGAVPSVVRVTVPEVIVVPQAPAPTVATTTTTTQPCALRAGNGLCILAP